MPARALKGSRSLLFLSCDLTGSTAFKQHPAVSPQAPWQKVFLQFYREFPQALESAKAMYGGSDAGRLEFSLWKPIGDELIFSCHVRRESDIYNAIKIWLEAMRDYRETSLSDESLGIPGAPRLGVKGGAFIATFPGPDSEASIPRDPKIETSGRDVVALNREALVSRRSHARFLYDYFGPSIDTGFRVLSRCTARFFTLSVEVAYAIAALRVMNTKLPFDDINVHLHETTELRGVWQGREYPIFAIDLEEASAVNKALAAFSRNENDSNLVLDLCRACYRSDNWPFRLYLPESSEQGDFCDPPIDALRDYVPETSSDGNVPTAIAIASQDGATKLSDSAPLN